MRAVNQVKANNLNNFLTGKAHLFRVRYIPNISATQPEKSGKPASISLI